MTLVNRRTSLAAVFRSPEKSLELARFEWPELKAGEAMVQITCCTICGSDLHTIRGDRPVAGPTVLGHEMLGTIAELSTDGEPLCDVAGEVLQIGDRITWSVAASCGSCFFCNQGHPQKCVELFKFGHETTDRCALSGGLAEFCLLVRGTAIVKVPQTVPDHVASPANCATSTVAAAMRTAGGCRDKAVVIHGAGMLGLTAAAMARTERASCVIVTDVSNDRLAQAAAFGATQAINVSNGVTQLANTVRDSTSGRGVDLVFEMSGAPQAIEQSISQLRIGGQLILVGSVFETRNIQLAPDQIVRKLLRIEGVHNYLPQDLQTAVGFLTKHGSNFPFASLVTLEKPLTEIDALVRETLNSTVVRACVRPSGNSAG